jgi:hypothetical protein
MARFDGNWEDGKAGQVTAVDAMDENNHLAKERVAGSNPVVRTRKVQVVALRGGKIGVGVARLGPSFTITCSPTL